MQLPPLPITANSAKETALKAPHRDLPMPTPTSGGQTTKAGGGANTQGGTVRAYGYAREASTLAELEEVGAVPESMRMQALLVRERILGPAHPDTSYYIRYRGAVYADAGQFERCVELWMYALDMQLALLEPLNHLTQSSLLSFAELFSFMLAVPRTGEAASGGMSGSQQQRAEAPTLADSKADMHAAELVSLIQKACTELVRARRQCARRAQMLKEALTKEEEGSAANKEKEAGEPMDTSPPPSSSVSAGQSGGAGAAGAGLSLGSSSATCNGHSGTCHREGNFTRLQTIILHLLSLMLRLLKRSGQPEPYGRTAQPWPNDNEQLAAVLSKPESAHPYLLRRAVFELLRTEEELAQGSGPSLLHMVVNVTTSVIGRYPVCTFPSADMVRLLLDLGADPNVTDACGITPLHTALAGRNDKDGASGTVGDAVVALLEGGAHIDCVNDGGESPLQLLQNAEKNGGKAARSAAAALNPLMSYVSLQCLCARVIADSDQIEYRGVVARHLEEFIDMH